MKPILFLNVVLLLFKPWPCLPAYNLLEDDVNSNSYDKDGYDIWGDSTNRIKNNSLIDNRRGKVLNFFPIPVEEECKPLEGNRKGICLNTYECRIQGGKSSGSCALGFGVCCIFSVTCGGEVINNITYFVNPDFPGLSRHMSNCEIKIKKIDPEISQLRLDFIHFHLGQPNRNTGHCDDDVFKMSGSKLKELKMCGLNSGQHVYYDVEDVHDEIHIKMKLNKRSLSRLWEVRIIQVPFSQRAPTGCLQYHTGMTGVVQTMNFADNGRHLADQDYTICMRQEEEMCSIAYEPCYENSFRIGPVAGRPGAYPDGLIGGYPGYPGYPIYPGAAGYPGMFPGMPGGGAGAGILPGALPGTLPGQGLPGGVSPVLAEETPADPVVGEGSEVLGDEPVAEEPILEEPVEDLGEDPVEDLVEEPVEADPEDDTLGDDAVGSGDGAVEGRSYKLTSTKFRRKPQKRDPPGLRRYKIENGFKNNVCNDRIIMPCDSEDLIMPGMSGPGLCDLVHCGTSFCPAGEPLCRVESSITPFTIGIQFGPASPKGSPEDNLGMCLFYEQLPCAV